MGQRLNMQISRKGKVLANSYYHWSGYTGSSSYILEQVYLFITSHPEITDKKLLAIRALEYTGAGFGEDDLNYLKRSRKYFDLTFKEVNDRNSGILSVSPKSIKETQQWAEGTVDIDIDTLLIDSDVFCFYNDFEEVKDYFKVTEDDIKEFDIDTTSMDIGCYRDLIDEVCNGTICKVLDGYVSEL